MKQEIVAGIIFVVMGLSILFVPPNILWMVTEKWKTKNVGQPSKGYIIVMRLLGVIFALTGGYLIKLAVK